MSTTSPIPNQISAVFSPDTLQTVHGALQTLTDTLNPLLVNLGPEEKQALPKMGPRTSDFVARTMSYMRAMPQYLPGFVDIDEFQKDLDAVATLGELQHQLGTTHDMVNATRMLAGSEAYVAALSIYEALKTAARRGSPEAQAAAADLAERLGPRGRSKPAPKEVGAPPMAPSTAPGV